MFKVRYVQGKFTYDVTLLPRKNTVAKGKVYWFFTIKSSLLYLHFKTK